MIITNTMVGLAGLAVLIIAIGAGVPIAVALGLTSLVGIVILAGVPVAMSVAGDTPFDTVASWDLSAIPMFVLMGAFAHASGISATIFEAARVWSGRIPGGPLIATNIASGIFAAASGSSMATAAAMARLAIPQMARAGYHRGFAAATVAAAGTVGALIPPSILLIIYGIFAQVSIGQLFMAGILPGLLTIAVYCFAIVVITSLRPGIAPKTPEPVDGTERRKAKVRALVGVWPGAALVIIVIGGIYLGVFTPVEAGAAGAATAFIIGLLRRKMSRASLWNALRESVAVSAQVFFIAVGATLFKQFLLLSGLTDKLASVAQAYAHSPELVMLAAFVVFLILGAFLDAIGLILVTMPIFLPIFHAVDADMIWVGVLLVKFVEIGVITPPVGLHVFVVANVASSTGYFVPVEEIFKSMTVYFVCELFIVGLLIFVPAITLLIPRLMN